jgi:molecular chaperone GrpE
VTDRSTEGRRPAGAPAEEPRPAGTPEERQQTADSRHEGQSDEQKVEHDLDQLLADVRRERDEYLELAQRARADFENYRKRAARDVTEAERRGRSSLARELVPVIDNLERALLAAGVELNGGTLEPADQRPSEEVSAHEALARGVALVLQDLRESLERAGVESYDPAGERFDPEWHEALSTRPSDGAESGTVLETVEKGYRLDGQVLRPARVVVAQ